MKDKIKNWIIGILFAFVVGLAIAYTSAEPVKANSTYVDNSRVSYDVINVNGTRIAVFKCGSALTAVKL